MDPLGLDWLLPEVLFHLCLFLSEADITSLSQSCQRLREVLNVDQVWERFVTEEINSLKTIKQQLDPPFHPDPNFCESRQHLQRRDQLISNWRNVIYINKSKNIEKRFRVDHNILFALEYYKEDYLLAKFDEDYYHRHHVFWDISGRPVLHAEKPFYTFFYLLGDAFACTTCCRVEVYQLNIEEKAFPFLYSFTIEGEIVENQPKRREDHNHCPPWVVSKGGSYLVFSIELPNPVVHIWNIAMGEKVGVFSLPAMCTCVDVHSVVDDLLVLKTNGGEETVYFKFCTRTNTISNARFKAVSVDESTSAFFYKDYCIVMKDSSTQNAVSVLCETYEFNTSKKMRDRCFPDAVYELQRKNHVHSVLK